jgi:hypothetical protein
VLCVSCVSCVTCGMVVLADRDVTGLTCDARPEFGGSGLCFELLVWYHIQQAAGVFI